MARAAPPLLSVITVLCVALLAGCGGGSSSPAAQTGRGLYDPIPGMRVTGANQPLTPSEQSFVIRVRDRLMGACMREEGFAYETLPEYPPAPATYRSPDQLRRAGYGFDFSDYAASMGKGSGSAGIPPGVDEGEWLRALWGPDDAEKVSVQVPDGTLSASTEGCAAVANQQLFGSVANGLIWSDTLSGYPAALRGSLKSIDAYRAPLRAWQRCMEEAGLDVGEFDETSSMLMREVVRAYARGGSLDPDRVDEVASADADCQESSGLDRVREEVMGQARRRADRSLGFEGGELAAFDQALLARAKQR